MKTKQLETKRGVTLMELSVSILALMMFVGLLFIGAKAWKRGADRAACLMNIRQVQQSVRGYANMNGMDVGDPLLPVATPHKTVIGPDKLVAVMPFCPAGGLYTFNGAVVPPVGTLFMTCSLAASADHVPDGHDSW